MKWLSARTSCGHFTTAGQRLRRGVRRRRGPSLRSAALRAAAARLRKRQEHTWLQPCRAAATHRVALRPLSRRPIRAAKDFVLRPLQSLTALFALLLLPILFSNRVEAQSDLPAPGPLVTSRPGRILIRPRPGKSLVKMHETNGARRLRKFAGIGGLEVVEVPAGMTADELIARYQKSGLVRYAEKDHIVHAQLEPNDPYFVNGTLWQLKNTGQSSGISGADIHVTSAWDTTTSASSVIVAVVDSGVRYTHEDLAPNMWRNPGEIAGNGRDDDGDGWIDDVYGINTISDTGDPNDDYGHGSHVAGIIGAKGFNGVGVAGICWSVQIMSCKFVDSHGNGSVSDAITCIDYARSKGAKIINFSWGDATYNSQALYDAIAAARDAGIIFTAACGNNSANIDAVPYYPASFALDNIISVAATTRRDELAGFSSYGPSTVDLGAPGDTILSCWYTANNSYHTLSGTSMSAPMVAGACALLWAQYPSESYADIIHRVLWNTDPVSQLAGKCVSGGRLNVTKALQAPPPTPPPTVTVAVSDSTATIGTSDNASFVFSRTGDTTGPLTVDFQLGGSAVQWDDYRLPSGDMPEFFTIPAGAASATMVIQAIGNETHANPETVTLALVASPTYTIGSQTGGTITIYPAIPPVIRSVKYTPPGNVTLTWSSVPNANYQVRYITNATTGQWQNIGNLITATSTNSSWTSAAPGSGLRLFAVVRTN